MKRLTQAKTNHNDYMVEEKEIQPMENGFSGNAILKLAQYENFHDDLMREQEKISLEMQKLRSDGKTRTVTFKQLLANKLANSQTLILLGSYGLRE
jgi:hypothetical protein